MWYLDAEIPSSLFHKHLNMSVFLQHIFYLPRCIQNALDIWFPLFLFSRCPLPSSLLSSCVCCAVSVDLWHRSQGPLLTAHLYLYCRDTAHSDRGREPGPCGYEQEDRGWETQEEGEWGEKRKGDNSHCNKVSEWWMKQRRKNGGREREVTKYHNRLKLTTLTPYPPQRELQDPIPCLKAHTHS